LRAYLDRRGVFGELSGAQNSWTFTRRQQIIISNGMFLGQNHRDARAVYAWRVLTGWVAALVLATALVFPGQAMLAGALHGDERTGSSVSLANSEQGAADLASEVLVSHIHFEHHQLIRSEIATILPALEAVRACYLTCLNPLASLEPYPLREPPRA
jgi:hypothetical protein